MTISGHRGPKNSRRNAILKKLSAALAVATIGFAVSFSAPAEAKQKNVHVNKTVHVNRSVTVNRNVRVNRAVGTRYVVGQRYNGHVWYGRKRHFWRGRWYGPCWMRIGGLRFWNEAACPI